MKIVSWNCNGCFRKKIDIILRYQADVYVIQECESPEKYEKALKNKLKTWFWCGHNSNKGLLIFTNSDIQIVNNHWDNYGLQYFLSVNIENSFDLIGVWTKGSYIEEYYVYHQIHHALYSNNTIIIGDFNSNVIWDKKHGVRNHSAVVSQLEDVGLFSAYHMIFHEKQGEETIPTFYMNRNQDKGYHIDYCFVSPILLKSFVIDNQLEWLSYSDHIPLILIV